MSDRIALVGAGPLALNVAGIVEKLPQYELVGFIDHGPSPIADIDVVGDDSALGDLFDAGVRKLVVCIGDPERRMLVARQLLERGFELPPVLHPGADLGLGVNVAIGCVIFPGVTILPRVEIGAFCVVEAQVFIGHDSTVGAGCLLGARALVGNHAVLGEGVRLGMGASVRSGAHVPAGAKLAEFDRWQA
jgi:UDP-3-O-[3-hydroxymyristoyl] glucosamine N-acyltransferase